MFRMNGLNIPQRNKMGFYCRCRQVRVNQPSPYNYSCNPSPALRKNPFWEQFYALGPAFPEILDPYPGGNSGDYGGCSLRRPTADRCADYAAPAPAYTYAHGDPHPPFAADFYPCPYSNANADTGGPANYGRHSHPPAGPCAHTRRLARL